MSHARLDQDPEWKFDAKPPDWMIALAVMFAIAIHLTAAIIIDVVELLFP